MINNIFKQLFFFLSLFCLTTSYAQQGSNNEIKYSVSGEISDSVSKQPLSYANIGLLRQSDSTFYKGTTTEIDGKFEIPGVKEGNYLLKISYMGYNPPLISVIVKGNDKKIKLSQIKVLPKVQNLETVEISDKKPVYQFNADKKVYNVGEDPSVQSGVAADAMQNAPGVWVDLEGNITLRGVSGVAIWINDKPSKLTPEALKTYLQQLPANSLDRIEVITNPSAKYSASGTGGIINIILKGAVKKNFFLSIGVNATTKPTVSPWTSVVWSNEKVKMSIYANCSDWVWKGNSSSQSTIYQNNSVDTAYTLNSASDWNGKYSWAYGHFNLEYQINEKNSIEGYIGGSYNWSHSNSNSSTSKNDHQIFQIFNIDETSSQKGNGNSIYGGITYNHNFNKEGHKLSLDVYGHQYQNTAKQDYNQIYSTTLFKNNIQRSSDSYLGNGIYLNAEYFYPFNDSTSLEAGITGDLDGSEQMNYTDTLAALDQSYYFANYLSNRNNSSDPNIAGYISFSSKIGNFSYKAGLRSEYQYYHLNSIVMEQNFYRNYWSLYPSIYLAYSTKSMHNISISYSRRVEYPNYQLDPFINYADPESLNGGNPDLKASFTDSYELGYSKYFKNGSSLSTSLYYRYTGKDIASVTDPVFDTIINRYTLYSTYLNCGKNSFLGVEVTGSWRPADFVTVILDANGYYNHIQSEYNGYSVDKEQFSWDVKLSPTFTFLKNFKAQVTGIYKSSTQSLQGENKPDYYINAFIRADFFNRKLSVNVGMQDIFNWQKNNSTTNTQYYTSTNSSKNISQYVSAGITWRFGKIEMENEVKTGQGAGQK
jgi:outer membrane receptor protein involved in Fe transport